MDEKKLPIPPCTAERFDLTFGFITNIPNENGDPSFDGLFSIEIPYHKMGKVFEILGKEVQEEYIKLAHPHTHSYAIESTLQIDIVNKFLKEEENE